MAKKNEIIVKDVSIKTMNVNPKSVVRTTRNKMSLKHANLCHYVTDPRLF